MDITKRVSSLKMYL